MREDLQRLYKKLKNYVDRKLEEGSFGGGGSADWNANDENGAGYIKNRPFYSDGNTVYPLPEKFLPEGVPYCVENGTVQVLPEVTITADDSTGMMAIYNHFTLEQGAAYTVVWNGVHYECTAKHTTLSGESAVTLGNMSLVSAEENTGEPFLLGRLDNPYIITGIAVSAEGLTSVTLEILAPEYSVRKLPKQCLDMSWIPSCTESFLVRDVQPQWNEPFLYYADFPSSMISEGMTLALYLDGERYQATVYKESGGTDLFIRHFRFDGFIRDGELALEVNDHSPFATPPVLSAAAVSFNKMDKSFMPEYMDSIVLRAPTGGIGSKLFRITVDETGTLSAAEVEES